MNNWWKDIKIVKAKNIKDYLRRYYKPDRRIPELLASYEKEYAEQGFITTSRHDNVLCIFIGWPSHKPMAKYWAKNGMRDEENQA